MKVRTLTKQVVEKRPFEIWNAFVDLLAREDYEDLSEIQRAAHLVFWYDSEVQNGGHLQYFENRGTEHLPQTIVALRHLGAECQQLVLRDAGDLFLSRERTEIRTAEEYCATALEGEFSECDSRFYNCSPDLTERLKTHLALHESSFVVIV
jgi:hypothetical protein